MTLLRPSSPSRRTPSAGRRALAALACAALATPVATLALASPAAADGGGDAAQERIVEKAGSGSASAGLIMSDNIEHVGANPSQLAISGCFMHSAPIFVTSGLDSVRVYDVSDPLNPSLQGVLPQAVFENEAMTCGERRTPDGVRRFVLIGVDLYSAAPTGPEHTNVGGGQLNVVDVTDPTAPTITASAPGLTSTHTVACVDGAQCRYAYSAGDSGSGTFSVFDLRDLDAPREVDGDKEADGLQAFASPTAGHKWNFDAAGVGTHTGFDGSSMWSTRKPARPRLLATTGLAGQGEDPDFEGYNDFIHHNSFRPNAQRFKPGVKPSLRNGNVLLVTEEDYEQTDCALAGSFQTWWVKRLDGKPGSIVPLDKVELADLGNFPLPQGAFCSSHWFDYRPGGLVAVGFYGGGTQILDVTNPREITSHAHAIWGASEVWDAMWVPVYKDGEQTAKRTNIVYAIDLVRGLDVYSVDVTGAGGGALRLTSAASTSERLEAGSTPLVLVGGAALLALGLGRVRRRVAVARD
ncbi:LVIVD repeat-containing protein [Nocardioides ginkgobilobae]